VALLFVDIEDGDILWAEIPQAMTCAAKIYFTILRSVWAQMGGYEVKSEGDAVMVAFQDVQSALSTCLRCQTYVSPAITHTHTHTHTCTHTHNLPLF
jgi:adenylate cyclase